MDFVHYQPPRDRESKVKPEKRDLQRAAEQGPLGVGIKAQLRTADFASQDPLVSPMDDAEDVETSTRPRLSPEQVWLLERQFQAHPKPSSHRKRQLAEMTKLSLPRVANWFQNRRAKAKHQKKHEETELSRAVEAISRSNSEKHSSPEMVTVTGVAAERNIQATPRTAPTLVMRNPLGDSAQVSTHLRRLHGRSHSSHASVAGSSIAAKSVTAQGSLDVIAGTGELDLALHDANLIAHYALLTEAHANNGPPASSTLPGWVSNQDRSLIYTPACQIEDPFDFSHLLAQSSHETQPDTPSMGDGIDEILSGPSDLRPAKVLVENAMSAEAFRSHGPSHKHESAHYQVSTSVSPPLLSDGGWPQQAVHPTNPNRFNLASLPSQCHQESPRRPGPSLNIAARRKRPRPAALGNAALRAQSMRGPMPASPTVDGVSTGPGSPVRRIRSAGNGCNSIAGRVQKPTSASVQRSPLNHSSFLQANMLEASHASQSGVTTKAPLPPASNAQDFPPPTPSSPWDVESLQWSGSDNQGSHEWGGVSYTGCSNLPISPSLHLQPGLASPPTTPDDLCLQPYSHNSAFFEQPPFYSQDLAGVDHAAVDELIFSPQFTSFSPQIHMPQPLYGSPIYCGDPDLAKLLRETESSRPLQMEDENKNGIANRWQSMPEFRFHNPSPQRHPQPRLSPPKQKSYIFNNHTPADFD